MKEPTNEIKKFWTEYCKLSKNTHDKPNTIPQWWAFGDNPEMADDLLSYVLSGEKTTTSGMVLDYQYDNDPIPKVGEKSIILNGKQEPICVIENINVQRKKFNDVDEEFALKEGEGFRSLQDWRDLHWEFFTRRCEVIGVNLTEEVELVCLEFKVVYQK